MSSTHKGVFLDVDSSIVENKLRITEDPSAEFNKVFDPSNNYPSKLVKPNPGFCVKTKEVGTDSKLFVNICSTDAIPPPKDLLEKELKELLDSDEPGEYRVPMSIGDLRSDKDKKGEDAKVCDIAINTTFFRKIQNSDLFKSFFLTLAFQAIAEKYGVTFTDEKIILQNRKVFGTLQVHRIQDREIAEKMGLAQPAPEWSTQTKPLIETISSTEYGTRTPEYRLFKRKSEPNCLVGEFKFPDVLSSKELTLDVGEDRILIECKSRGYLLDFFIPYIVRQESCSSTFERSSKILTLTMPLMGG